MYDILLWLALGMMWASGLLLGLSIKVELARAERDKDQGQ